MAGCVATEQGWGGGEAGVRRRYVGESVVLGSTNGTARIYSVLLLCLHRFAQARRPLRNYVPMCGLHERPRTPHQILISRT